jgi:hypothetical protein
MTGEAPQVGNSSGDLTADQSNIPLPNAVKDFANGKKVTIGGTDVVASINLPAINKLILDNIISKGCAKKQVGAVIAALGKLTGLDTTRPIDLATLITSLQTANYFTAATPAEKEKIMSAVLIKNKNLTVDEYLKTDEGRELRDNIKIMLKHPDKKSAEIRDLVQQLYSGSNTLTLTNLPEGIKKDLKSEYKEKLGKETAITKDVIRVATAQAKQAPATASAAPEKQAAIKKGEAGLRQMILQYNPTMEATKIDEILKGGINLEEAGKLGMTPEFFAVASNGMAIGKVAGTISEEDARIFEETVAQYADAAGISADDARKIYRQSTSFSKRDIGDIQKAAQQIQTKMNWTTNTTYNDVINAVTANPEAKAALTSYFNILSGNNLTAKIATPDNLKKVMARVAFMPLISTLKPEFQTAYFNIAADKPLKPYQNDLTTEKIMEYLGIGTEAHAGVVKQPAAGGPAAGTPVEDEKTKSYNALVGILKDLNAGKAGASYNIINAKVIAHNRKFPDKKYKIEGTSGAYKLTSTQ